MGTSRRGPQSKYQRLEQEMERSNQDFIEQQHNQQQVSIVESVKLLEGVFFMNVYINVINDEIVTGNDRETR